MKEPYVLTIKVADRSGLVHLVTGTIEKKRLRIQSLNLAVTDIHNIVLITIEIALKERKAAMLALKQESIIEVFAVETSRYDQSLCLRAAYFKMGKAFLKSPKAIALTRHSAVIVKYYPDAFLITQYGSDASILILDNELEGQYLLGFSQTELIGQNDEWRISRLAA